MDNLLEVLTATSEFQNFSNHNAITRTKCELVIAHCITPMIAAELTTPRIR